MRFDNYTLAELKLEKMRKQLKHSSSAEVQREIDTLQDEINWREVIRAGGIDI